MRNTIFKLPENINIVFLSPIRYLTCLNFNSIKNISDLIEVKNIKNMLSIDDYKNILIKYNKDDLSYMISDSEQKQLNDKLEKEYKFPIYASEPVSWKLMIPEKINVPKVYSNDEYYMMINK